MWLFLVIGLIFLVLLTSTQQQKQQESEKSKPYYDHIEEHTLRNRNYREVLTTTSNMQLVLMSLLPQEEIGFETHPTTSQFIRIEKGQGLAIIDQQRFELNDGDIIVIPPGAKHNIINTGRAERLQLYSIYTPPNHPVGTVEATKPLHHD